MSRNLEYYKIIYWWEDVHYNDTGIAITVLEKFQDEIISYEEVGEHIKEMYNYGDCCILVDRLITKPVYDQLLKQLREKE